MFPEGEKGFPSLSCSLCDKCYAVDGLNSCEFCKHPVGGRYPGAPWFVTCPTVKRTMGCLVQFKETVHPKSTTSA